MRVAVVATGLQEEPLGAPWLALEKTLRAWKQIPDAPELLLLRFADRGESHFRGFQSLKIPKLPGAPALAARAHGCEAILINGAPTRLAAAMLNRFGSLPTVAFIHGNHGFVDAHAFGGPVSDLNLRQKARRRVRQALLRRTASRIDRLVMNSHFTQRVWNDAIGVRPSRCTVSYLGLDHEEFRPVDPAAMEAMRREFGLEGSFILHVSAHDPRKNGPTVIRAFDVLRSRLSCQLVFAGTAWTKSRVTAALGSDDLTGIKLLGHVPHGRLGALYSAAEMLVIPSRHETFCMPIVEAMACGCPVITSNWSAMPEVAGGAAVLLDDPLDSHALADAMERLLTDRVERDRLRAEGLKRAAEFSWDRTARALIDATRAAVAEKAGR